jgi:NaMN:DMB phosphoribosyltransferase
VTAGAGVRFADATPGRLDRKVRRGTADMTVEPAMTRAQAVQAVEVGIAVARDLVAAALAPDCLDACVAGHRSAEPGHAVALAHLGLRPLVELELRLGEGTGALLALPLVQAAVRALTDMATFDSAGVVEKDEKG